MLELNRIDSIGLLRFYNTSCKTLVVIIWFWFWFSRFTKTVFKVGSLWWWNEEHRPMELALLATIGRNVWKQRRYFVKSDMKENEDILSKTQPRQTNAHPATWVRVVYFTTSRDHTGILTLRKITVTWREWEEKTTRKETTKTLQVNLKTWIYDTQQTWAFKTLRPLKQHVETGQVLLWNYWAVKGISLTIPVMQKHY